MSKIPNWISGTGQYSIMEDTTGNRWMECTSAGTCALQSETAYGSWEFDITPSANPIILIISDVKVLDFDQQYFLWFKKSDSNKLIFIRAATTLFVTNTNYYTDDILYGIKITRTKAGIFTVYIKGGSFGDNYVLVDTTGGNGTNPVTDNTYTESKYFVADLDVNDRLDNIVIKNGVKQL